MGLLFVFPFIVYGTQWSCWILGRTTCLKICSYVVIRRESKDDWEGISIESLQEAASEGKDWVHNVQVRYTIVLGILEPR